MGLRSYDRTYESLVPRNSTTECDHTSPIMTVPEKKGEKSRWKSF